MDNKLNPVSTNLFEPLAIQDPKKPKVPELLKEYQKQREVFFTARENFKNTNTSMTAEDIKKKEQYTANKRKLRQAVKDYRQYNEQLDSYFSDYAIAIADHSTTAEALARIEDDCSKAAAKAMVTIKVNNNNGEEIEIQRPLLEVIEECKLQANNLEFEINDYKLACDIKVAQRMNIGKIVGDDVVNKMMAPVFKMSEIAKASKRTNLYNASNILKYAHSIFLAFMNATMVLGVKKAEGWVVEKLTTNNANYQTAGDIFFDPNATYINELNETKDVNADKKTPSEMLGKFNNTLQNSSQNLQGMNDTNTKFVNITNALLTNVGALADGLEDITLNQQGVIQHGEQISNNTANTGAYLGQLQGNIGTLGSNNQKAANNNQKEQSNSMQAASSYTQKEQLDNENVQLNNERLQLDQQNQELFSKINADLDNLRTITNETTVELKSQGINIDAINKDLKIQNETLHKTSDLLQNNQSSAIQDNSRHIGIEMNNTEQELGQYKYWNNITGAFAHAREQQQPIDHINTGLIGNFSGSKKIDSAIFDYQWMLLIFLTSLEIVYHRGYAVNKQVKKAPKDAEEAMALFHNNEDAYVKICGPVKAKAIMDKIKAAAKPIMDKMIKNSDARHKATIIKMFTDVTSLALSGYLDYDFVGLFQSSAPSEETHQLSSLDIGHFISDAFSNNINLFDIASGNQNAVNETNVNRLSNQFVTALMNILDVDVIQDLDNNLTKTQRQNMKNTLDIVREIQEQSTITKIVTPKIATVYESIKKRLKSSAITAGNAMVECAKGTVNTIEPCITATGKAIGNGCKTLARTSLEYTAATVNRIGGCATATVDTIGGCITATGKAAGECIKGTVTLAKTGYSNINCCKKPKTIKSEEGHKSNIEIINVNNNDKGSVNKTPSHSNEEESKLNRGQTAWSLSNPNNLNNPSCIVLDLERQNPNDQGKISPKDSTNFKQQNFNLFSTKKNTVNKM